MVSKPAHPFFSGRFVARLVISIFVLCILLDLVSIGLGYSQIALLSIALTGQTIAEADATANDVGQQTIGILQIAAYLISAVFFLVWIYRVHRNLPALGIRRPEYTPGWAVGLFFVPILNLFRPYDIVKELWKVTNPDIGLPDTVRTQYSPAIKPYSSKSALVGLWWGSWIVAVIATRISSALYSTASEPSGLIVGTWAMMASDALSILGNIFAILIVKEIHARQEEKHRRLIAVQ